MIQLLSLRSPARNENKFDEMNDERVVIGAVEKARTRRLVGGVQAPRQQKSRIHGHKVL